jgi:hypothetical protein
MQFRPVGVEQVSERALEKTGAIGKEAWSVLAGGMRNFLSRHDPLRCFLLTGGPSAPQPQGARVRAIIGPNLLKCITNSPAIPILWITVAKMLLPPLTIR